MLIKPTGPMLLPVGPELAAAWLAYQPAQRGAGPPIEKRCAQIAADIAAGRWDPARGAAAQLNLWGYFDKGLHRLHAIVRTGQPVLLWVEGAGLKVGAEQAGAAEALAVARS